MEVAASAQAQNDPPEDLSPERPLSSALGQQTSATSETKATGYLR